MKFSTTRFGEIEVNLDESLFFPSGLIGFPELTRFILLNSSTNGSSPFKWLQSLDDGSIAFILINPLSFKPDYMVEVSDDEICGLELASEESAAISVIVTMPTNPEEMTANLKAPIIFNVENRRGKQVILNNPEYLTKHLIGNEIKKNGTLEDSGVSRDLIDKIKKDTSKIQKKEAVNV